MLSAYITTPPTIYILRTCINSAPIFERVALGYLCSFASCYWLKCSKKVQDLENTITKADSTVYMALGIFHMPWNINLGKGRKNSNKTWHCHASKPSSISSTPLTSCADDYNAVNFSNRLCGILAQSISLHACFLLHVMLIVLAYLISAMSRRLIHCHSVLM